MCGDAKSRRGDRFRVAEEEVYVLGHDDVAVDVESVADAGSFEGVFEEVFCGLRLGVMGIVCDS